jgi:hypothetical protein
VYEDLGIRALMVIDGVRVGDQDGGLPEGREFGQGHRSSATDHQISLCVHFVHVLDEGDDRGGQTKTVVGCPHFGMIGLAGLVNHPWALFKQS